MQSSKLRFNVLVHMTTHIVDCRPVHRQLPLPGDACGMGNGGAAGWPEDKIYVGGDGMDNCFALA